LIAIYQSENLIQRHNVIEFKIHVQSVDLGCVMVYLEHLLVVDVDLAVLVPDTQTLKLYV
jgi:hypothetical protein